MSGLAVMSRPISLAESTVGSDGFTRSWVELMPQRTYKTERYGTLDFSEPELRQYIKSFEAGARGVEIALDADHQALNHSKTEAYGWIERMALGEAIGKAPGLWAYVRWTKLGEEAVRGQIYRYISAEINPGTYLNETAGTKHTHVVIGATLTNRPVLKDIEPVTLAEVSTRAWGEVDKSCLPDSAFLDPKGRRLPVYEGAGPKDAKGRYTQRGKLNINGVRAALAAVHGARSGSAMTGLPAGTAAKLQRWLDQYSGGDNGGGGDAGSTKASEAGRNGVGTEYEDDEDLTLADPTEEPEMYADDDQDGDTEGSADDYDAASDTHGAMTTDGHAHGKYGRHGHEGDGDHSDAPMKRSKQMSEGVRVTMAEHLALVEEVKALKRAKHEATVEKWLGGWEAGAQQFAELRGAGDRMPSEKNVEKNAKVTATRAVKVALSRPAQRQARHVMLSDWFQALSDEQQREIAKSIELAATGAVDLSMRGGSNTTEQEKTTKLAVVPVQLNDGTDGDRRLRSFESAVRENVVALAEADGEDYDDLVKRSKALTADGVEAAKKVDAYQSRAYRQTLAGA